MVVGDIGYVPRVIARMASFLYLRQCNVVRRLQWQLATAC